MKLNLILFILLIIDLQNVLISQELSSSTQKKTISLNYAQQDIIHSRVLNEDRKINIYLPESFHEASKEHTYPVLVLLEDEFFYMTSGVIKHLSSVERMPETIVVSILDMSYIPTVFTNGSTFWGSMDKLSDEDPDLLTKHLKEELFPYLEANYQANHFKIVMGLSSTSLYTLHTFVKEPGLFDAHIAIAAGDILGMGYQKNQRFIDLILQEIKRSSDIKRYLYITSADGDGGGESPEIETNLKELEQILAPYRSDKLNFVSKIFPNEGHYDVALPALLEALGLIFPKEDWFARYRNIVDQPGNALKNIDEYYQKLSTKYGFKVLPRAERWNSVNRLSWIGPKYLIRQGRISEGIELIQRWSTYRPKSTLALSELAKAYEQNNQLKEALTTTEKAYHLSKELNLQSSDELLQQLERLKKKIQEK